MPVTATKLYAVQEKILRLIAATDRLVLPNDLVMQAQCREMFMLGLLARHGYIIDDGDGARHATAYSVSADGWAVLRGGK